MGARTLFGRRVIYADVTEINDNNIMFLADLKEFERYLKDFLDNGLTFQNVAGMISSFAGMVGDALIMLGGLKVGGALKVIQGIGEIVIGISDIAENGVNAENALTVIRGPTKQI